MGTATQDQETFTKFDQATHLLTWIEAFLIDRKVSGLAEGTISFYRKKLKLFTQWCDTQLITQITEITPDQLRLYLLHLEESGHNPGGIHAAYRTLRAFLFWWEREIELEGWKNPIHKVKYTKKKIDPIEPVDVETVKRLIATCQRGDFYGERDRAILLALMDTGARAQEFLDVNLADVDQVSGAILIREGKGRKPRTVFLGRTSRKAVRAYLKRRKDQGSALWVNQNGERLSYDALRAIMRRRSKLAGVDCPSLHDFRRYFALAMLRNGVDLFSLQKLMGHADLQVLRRYLAQTDQDTIEAHRKGGPVDNAGI